MLRHKHTHTFSSIQKSPPLNMISVKPFVPHLSQSNRFHFSNHSSSFGYWPCSPSLRLSLTDSLHGCPTTTKIPVALFQQTQHRFPYSQEVDTLCNSKKRCDDQCATCCSLQERRWALPSHDAPAKYGP